MKPILAKTVSRLSDQNAGVRGHPSLACNAFACPLPGSILSGANWYCRHHHAINPLQNDLVTKSISAHLWILELGEAIARPDLIMADTRADAPFAHLKSADCAQSSGISVLICDHATNRIQLKNRPDLLPGKVRIRHGVMIDEAVNYVAWSARLICEFDRAVTCDFKVAQERFAKERGDRAEHAERDERGLMRAA